MSDDMNDDPLKSLGKLKAPTPSEAARQRAMSAGMAAFEASKTHDNEKNLLSPPKEWVGASVSRPSSLP